MAPNTLLGILGALLVGFAAIQALPIAVALGLDEKGSALAFALSAGAAVFFGVVLMIAGTGVRRALGRRDAVVLAVVAWLTLAVFGALPFAFAGAVYGYSRALFEAMSGLTTTGLSAIDGLAATDRSLVLWRALLQWLGGYGTVLFAATLVPQVALVAPGGGPEPESRRAAEAFRPRLVQIAGRVGAVYLGLTLACVFALLAAGLAPLAAAAYAMSAISTGGFAPDAGGPQALGDAAQAILVVAMIAGAVNFLVHWAGVSGRPGTYLRDPECGFLAVLVAAATVLLAVAYTGGGLATAESWWRALFDAVSAATTTGFGGAPAQLPVFALLVLAGLAVIGGSSVSTAGGIKLMRALLLLRQSARELERLAHPHGVVLIKLGRVSVTDAAMQGVWAFFVLFIFCLIVLSIALSATGLGFASALVLATSAMANTGPLLAETAAIGGALGALPDAAHWLLAAGMLVGRLEVLAVLVLLTPLFWKR